MARFWLRAARWLVAGFAIGQFILSAAGVVLFAPYAQTHLEANALTPNDAWTGTQVQAALRDLHWPATTMAWISLSRGLIGLLLIYPIVFLLLARKSEDGFGIFAALVFALISPVGGVALLPLYAPIPALVVANKIIGAIGWQAFFILFYLFPDGRPVPGWTRWLVWVWGSYVVLQIVTLDQTPAILGQALNPDSQVGGAILVGCVLIAIGSQVYRYFWRSDTLQRQQTKLVVYILAMGSAVVGSALPWSFRAPNPLRLGTDLIVATGLWYLFGLTFVLVPAAIGVAILRHRLFDIDVIIRRTLIYALLTGLLALAYFGSVLVLQNTFSALTGQAQSTLVTVLSTLVIAALFVPLRARVQTVIDRRLYRRKYDSAKTLALFSATLRDEVDLGQLSEQLVGVVDDTMQPASVGLWLRAPERRQA